MITSKDIEKETRILERIIENLEQKNSEIAEKGKLRICQKKKQTDFYYRNNNSENWTYLPKSEANLASALAQKDYYEKALKILRRKYRAFSLLDGENSTDALLRLYDKLHPVRKSLVAPVILTDEEYAKKWKAENPPSGKFNDEYEYSYYTDGGERVRSKSEIMIANKFLQRQIPYIYEPSLTLGNRTVYPDFMILNIRTRQSFYYEHLGMMDSPDYSTKAILKLNSYIMNGYFPGQGLLFTMETTQKPLDMRILDALIDKFLL